MNIKSADAIRFMVVLRPSHNSFALACEWIAGVLAGWPAGVPRLRSTGGEDAAWPAAETAAFR
jgi:hypothetical protein